jgi:hypothetical protein
MNTTDSLFDTGSSGSDREPLGLIFSSPWQRHGLWDAIVDAAMTRRGMRSSMLP